LKRLLLNECSLDGMRISICFQALERDDFLSGDALYSQLAGSRRAVVHQHGAGAALSHAATESRVREFQVVAQYIQERTLRVHIHFVNVAIHS
jgi:hypothetical protein